MPFIISICDDDTTQVGFIREILNKWSLDKPFSVHICEYESAEQFMFEYPDNPCDILLLDIEMPGLNGMELAWKLRNKGDMLPIIFITGFSDYISDGYDVEALHYLLKPLDVKKLYKVLDRYINKKAIKSEDILIATADGSMRISTNNITHIEAQGRKTLIFIRDGKPLECVNGISIFAAKKLSGFVQCHRSYIVNLRYVKTISRSIVTLDNGVEISLSRRLYSDVNKMFIEFYMR